MNRREAQRLLTNLEFIKAFAEGQTIQCRQLGKEKWEDLGDTGYFDGEYVEYRIKPRPIEGWVNLYKDGTAGSMWPTRELAEERASAQVIKCVFVREVEGK